jgi:DNA transposition AAA+ family ATPase
MAGKKSKTQRPKLMSDQLRQAINECGVSRYRLARTAGVSETSLSMFVNKHRGLSMKNLDAVGKFLQLTIHIGRKPE